MNQINKQTYWIMEHYNSKNELYHSKKYTSKKRLENSLDWYSINFPKDFHLVREAKVFPYKFKMEIFLNGHLYHRGEYLKFNELIGMYEYELKSIKEMTWQKNCKYEFHLYSPSGKPITFYNKKITVTKEFNSED